MNPMVYDAVFIFYAISVYLRFVILYLVEDQLNLGKVRLYGGRVCYVFLVMKEQISFWGPLDLMVDRGLITVGLSRTAKG